MWITQNNMKNRLNCSHNGIEISNYLSGRQMRQTNHKIYFLSIWQLWNLFFMQLYNNKEQSLHLVNPF